VKHVRLFLILEALGFALAALVHAGVLVDGYQHREATIAESVISAALAIGLAASLAAPGWARGIALGVQAFALIGTGVGLFTIAIGIGPQSAFDLVLHAGFVALLVAGLISVAREPRQLNARA